MARRGEGSGKTDGSARPYQINVLDRAVAILDAFGQHGPTLSLSEIAGHTGLHVSTCLRLLSNLRHHGLVARDEDGGRYRLGYRLLAMAELARGDSGLVEVALPTMRDLSRLFNETVVISVRVGDARVDLEQVVGQQSVRRVVTLGVEKPLYAGAASRVLLAGLTAAELDDYFERVELKKLASRTITNPETLRGTLAEIRAKGYAESVQEQFDDSGGGIVAPVFGGRGEIVAALGMSVPQFRFTEDLRKRIIPEVVKSANTVSRAIGGRTTIPEGTPPPAASDAAWTPSD
ncbi:helix-turn-helix domain-containing protein [Rhodobacterales bacterium HKCCE2091]|nr:helix-turn-helix domain-containing protein [Rhodobacterales bacterium HKCCE2091]